MKRKVYTIGETVYDIIFRNGQVQTGKVGGAMLNASISLARVAMDVSFISETGDDDLGKIIHHFLEDNQVNSSHIHCFDNGQTPVALAFLDKHQNAQYSFYKNYPEKRLPQNFPEIGKNDILLFGSFFAINPHVRNRVLELVKQAKQSGAIIIYDPNIRNLKGKELKNLLPAIYENFTLADVVRASHEDFNTLFGVTVAEDALNIFRKHSSASFIFTHSSEYIFLDSGKQTNYFPVPKINLVSSIGAGDNFNAGVIYSLLKESILKEDLKNLNELQWEQIINCGISFSQQVCTSFDNYLPEGFSV